jgi:uncharacterized protein YggE
MFKRIGLVALTVGMLAAVALGGTWMAGQGTTTAAAQTSDEKQSYDPTQTITVVGQGAVSVSPDIARVTVGVETSAESVGEAVADNRTQMEAILAALEEIGIPEKDLQTTNFSIYFDRYPEPLPRSVSGAEGAVAPQYRVSNMVNVTIRDLEKVSEVLDGVIEAGANNIWGVSFELDDTETAQADARTAAVANALARAQALAELSELELGPVMSVSEVIGTSSMPIAFAAERSMGGGGGPISPGEVEINYQVQVSYFIAR